jgi:hypothetical protein
MMLRLFCMFGSFMGSLCGFCKQEHQLVFLSLDNCEIKFSGGFDKHRDNKSGQAG